MAALVTNLIEADTLMLLTDQAGLYDADPRSFPGAKVISEARASDEALNAMAGGGSALGRGGMVTKLAAARIAARSGANTVIAGGREPGVIAALARGEVMGTVLTADEAPLVSRKQWLASLPSRGELTLDDGAVKVLRADGRSLLPVGVRAVSGAFTRGDMASCLDSGGVEIARGLINYNHEETAAIAGRSSREIESTLGYLGDEELIHRDNLVLNS